MYLLIYACMYVCVCVCVYVCMHVFTRACVRIYVCVCVWPRLGGFDDTTITLWSPVARSDIAWNFEKVACVCVYVRT